MQNPTDTQQPATPPADPKPLRIPYIPGSDDVLSVSVHRAHRDTVCMYASMAFFTYCHHLTPAEARELAAHLVACADACSGEFDL